jgi:hypothetical protein
MKRLRALKTKQQNRALKRKANVLSPISVETIRTVAIAGVSNYYDVATPPKEYGKSPIRNPSSPLSFKVS